MKKKEGESEEDTSDNQEYETDEGEGPVASKVKKDAKSGMAANFGEVSVPEGMDAAQWEAGFKDAMDKFYTAAAEGADEVVHNETEDQTADYLAGIEAGFEFAQTQLNRIGSDSIGSATHNQKPDCCESDEESDGEGPVASKVKKNAKSGESECCAQGDNNYAETTKKGKDGLKGTEKNEMAEDEDEEKHAESSFGRDKVGKATQPSKRKEKGTGKEEDRAKKGTAPEEDRAKTGTAPDQDRAKTGKGKDVQLPNDSELKHGGGASGSGKAVKSPAVTVKYINHSEGSDFAELTARLEQLEAMNAKLVAEKQAAERHAHRIQLEEFAESLFATGRLTPAVIDQDELVDYVEGLESGTLEFAEGETAATKLMELLASLPAQVSFAEIAPHNTDEVPDEALDPHEKALRMSKEQNMSYTEALKVTLFEVE